MSTKEESYPRFKYHAKETPVIVLSKDEEAALGKGWENSPAEFDGHIETAPAAGYVPPKHKEEKEEKPKGKHK